MKTYHKLSIIFLKYAPFIAGILMWMHVILKICGVNWFVAENLVGLPIIPCVICCVWSYTFNFCLLHRIFIAYTSLVTYCINFHTDIFGFGDMVGLVRWLLFDIGLILIILFIIKQCKNKHKLYNEKVTNN